MSESFHRYKGCTIIVTSPGGASSVFVKGKNDFLTKIKEVGSLTEAMAFIDLRSSKKILLLTGAAGSGKSTIAKALIRPGNVVRLPFAAPLKAMLAGLGLNDEQLNGSLKEVDCDVLSGRSPRYAMQTLGTEWGRDIMGRDFWTNLWRISVGKVEAQVVIADDYRFENEFQAALQVGVTIAIRIRRDGATAPRGISGHVSEFLAYLPVDHEVDNNGAIETTFQEVMRICRKQAFLE